MLRGVRKTVYWSPYVTLAPYSFEWAENSDRVRPWAEESMRELLECVRQQVQEAAFEEGILKEVKFRVPPKLDNFDQHPRNTGGMLIFDDPDVRNTKGLVEWTVEYNAVKIEEGQIKARGAAVRVSMNAEARKASEAQEKADIILLWDRRWKWAYPPLVLFELQAVLDQDRKRIMQNEKDGDRYPTWWLKHSMVLPYY
jgi:hypothetical protein